MARVRTKVFLQQAQRTNAFWNPIGIHFWGCAGHDIIMAPTSHTYFDYYQAGPDGEPEAIGGMLPLEKVYSFEPIPEELGPQDEGRVLGAQAQLWSEHLHDWRKVEYMAFPRLLALAEVVWSPKQRRPSYQFETWFRPHSLSISSRP